MNVTRISATLGKRRWLASFLSMVGLILGFPFLSPAQNTWLQQGAPDPLKPESWLLFSSGFPAAHGLDTARPVSRGFSLDLGRSVVKLKASYAEKREPQPPAPDSSPGVRVGRYFHLAATSSPLALGIVGESELAYSMLSFTMRPEDRPIQARVGLRGSWDRIAYGAEYRATGSGFVSLAGARVNHARKESQVWGEYDFGLLRIRGAVGEMRETHSDTHFLSLVRTAAGSLDISRPHWNAALTSTYSVTRQGPEDRETTSLSSALVLAYRPAPPLSIEPTFSLREQWDDTSGVRTDTPSAGLAIRYTLLRDLMVTAHAGYAREFSADPSANANTLRTAAVLSWILGRSRAGETRLSFNVEYSSRSRLGSARSEPASVLGQLQLRIGGF